MRLLITETRVPMLTPTQLVERFVPAGSPVRYVQIDVEGMDDRVVGALPFENPSFAPEVIVFEFIQTFLVFCDELLLGIDGFIQLVVLLNQPYLQTFFTYLFYI